MPRPFTGDHSRRFVSTGAIISSRWFKEIWVYSSQLSTYALKALTGWLFLGYSNCYSSNYCLLKWRLGLQCKCHGIVMVVVFTWSNMQLEIFGCDGDNW
jgi:hypothetical protein